MVEIYLTTREWFFQELNTIFYVSIVLKPGFMIDEYFIWIHLSIGLPDGYGGFINIQILYSDQGSVIIIFM